MTVKELASKMNELCREGYSNDLVFFSFGNSKIHYPINSHQIGPLGNIIKRVVTLKCDPDNTIFQGPQKLPIEKSDLENAQRATFNPNEEPKDQ